MCPNEVSTESLFNVTKQRDSGRCIDDSMYRNLSRVDNKAEDWTHRCDCNGLARPGAPRNAHPLEHSDNIHMIAKTPRHIPAFKPDSPFSCFAFR
jgi:hypothetical protein